MACTRVSHRIRMAPSDEGHPALTAEITPTALESLDAQVGSPLWISLKATEIDTYSV